MVLPPNSPQPEVNEAKNLDEIDQEIITHPNHPLAPSDQAEQTWPIHTWWQNTRQHLQNLLPLEYWKKKLLDRLWVDEAEIADILAQLRQELPTTEALLIGKPQSGKSSLVRGLTGASAAIVGQGFQPHTQNTARYAYPSPELPLLIFTDTVGLGDLGHDTQSLIEELKTELADPQEVNPAAKILLLTVKITDFATDTLRQIIEDLKTAYPQIPCLLVVTCLHEIYPHPSDD
ncbi:GTPase family protein, partial [Synechocystis salina]|uniref:GTPase family protein n=1 Tax=Synechocystis salina TaxID=945780 RepID=UPI001D13C508